MITSDAISIASLGAMFLIALMMLVQYLKLLDIGCMIQDSKAAIRWTEIHETENRELRSALRAEKAHVEQLKRKLLLLQLLIPVA